MWIRCTFFLLLLMKVWAQQPIDVSIYQSEFENIAAQPNLLSGLMLELPKGADLHLHVSGAVRTEELIKIANRYHYCLNSHDEVLSDCQNGQPIHSRISSKSGRQQLMTSWSMYHFKPNQHEDGKKHFFDTFGKFRWVTRHHRADIVANILNQASEEHIQYLELMLSMVADRPYAQQHSVVFDNAVLKNSQHFENLYLAAYRKASSQGQKVWFSWIIEINREQPFKQFKNDATYAFAIAHRSPHVAAVNMVMPEYGHFSHHDYVQQMKCIQQLKKQYPDVKVVLHAGEIPDDFAKQDKMGHVSTALQFARPSRIGHGVSIVHEKNFESLMEDMKSHQTAVEINLTSNADILGVSGPQHPFGLYLHHEVPLVLSSDDPGVSRSTLSKEYRRAVIEQHLRLDTLIQMDRNSLTYSLLPGDSIWADPRTAQVVKACSDLNSKSCDRFVSMSPKAKQQRELEFRLEIFFKHHFNAGKKQDGFSKTELSLHR